MPEEHCFTRVRFTVNLTDLKRSCRRLLTRLPDESEAGGDFVVFNATGDGLQIVADSTSEGVDSYRLERGRCTNTLSRFSRHRQDLQHIPQAETYVHFLRWTTNS
jgi:hypothetical protein